MQNLVSVIIPVYRAKEYLCECLDSILAQTYVNFELILVDDGSPDGSGDICDEYAEKDARVRVIHKENGGVSSARNRGMEEASGEWIAFVDADDFVALNYLEKMSGECVQNNADIALCAHFKGFGTAWENRCANYCAEQINLRNREDALAFCARFVSASGLSNILVPCAGGLFFRRTLQESLKMNTKMTIHEDTLFLYQLLHKARRCTVVAEPLYYYRDNPSSALNVKYKPTLIDNDNIYIAELEQLFCEPMPQVTKRALRSCGIASTCRNIANVMSGKDRADLKVSIRAIKKSRFYKYFKLRYIMGLKKWPFKKRMQALILWFVTKTGLIYLLK